MLLSCTHCRVWVRLPQRLMPIHERCTSARRTMACMCVWRCLINSSRRNRLNQNLLNKRFVVERFPNVPAGHGFVGVPMVLFGHLLNGDGIWQGGEFV